MESEGNYIAQGHMATWNLGLSDPKAVFLY